MSTIPTIESDMSTSSSSANYWVDEFLLKRGNEFFCNVDEDYILDRFNLTGIAQDVEWYNQAMEIIIDKAELSDYEASTRTRLAKNCTHLYGLIHARYILTHRGLQKMAEKYRRVEFGGCPRTLCQNTPVLPIGLSDLPLTATVKLYCPRCQDVYHPRSTRHAALDAAYWGTTFPHLLLQSFPMLLEPLGLPDTKHGESRLASSILRTYTPKIFGFRIHTLANIQRQRTALKEALEQGQVLNGPLNLETLSVDENVMEVMPPSGINE